MKEESRMEFSDWDKAVMKIEEVFAAYQPEERNKLRDKVFDDIERGTGTDTQKQQARGAIETALENVENVPWIKTCAFSKIGRRSIVHSTI
jgi:hypothetical protein